jgi:hypothetical protein
MGGTVRKISNPRMLKRNKQIGNIGQIGGMLILAGGLAVTFYLPDRIDLSYLSLILGFILVNIGATFTNRWGRTPPPDQAVDDLLKGLDDRYTIVHYRLGAEHALFTPNGIVAVLSKYERGTVAYDGKKWRQSGVSGLMKFFGTESLGNPSADGQAEAEILTRKLRSILKQDEVPPVRPVIAFVNEATRIDADSSPVPALHASKVKEYIRHLSKTPTLHPDQMRQVLEYIGEKA